MFRRAKKGQERHIAAELLSAYLDGQVTPRECSQVEQHLRVCATCARELETLRYTTRLLRAVPRVSLPRAFTLSEAEVRREVARRRAVRALPYLRGATALVAALLLVVVVGDFLLEPVLYRAPQPAVVMERAVVETVVVEKKVEPEVAKPLVVEKVVEVEKPVEVKKVVMETPPPEKPSVVVPTVGPATAEVGDELAAEKPAQPQERALMEAQPEEGTPVPTLEATPSPVAKRMAEERVTPLASAEPTVIPLPGATPSEAVVSLAVPATPTPPPAATPPPPQAVPVSFIEWEWWEWLRPLEIFLAGLFLILLGFSIRLHKQR